MSKNFFLYYAILCSSFIVVSLEVNKALNNAGIDTAGKEIETLPTPYQILSTVTMFLVVMSPFVFLTWLIRKGKKRLKKKTPDKQAGTGGG